MESIRNYTRMLWAVLMIIVVSILISFYYWPKPEESESQVIDSFYCGTPSYTEAQEEGKKLFMSRCQACHLPTHDEILKCIERNGFILTMNFVNDENASLNESFIRGDSLPANLDLEFTHLHSLDSLQIFQIIDYIEFRQ